MERWISHWCLFPQTLPTGFVPLGPGEAGCMIGPHWWTLKLKVITVILKCHSYNCIFYIGNCKYFSHWPFLWWLFLQRIFIKCSLINNAFIKKISFKVALNITCYRLHKAWFSNLLRPNNSWPRPCSSLKTCLNYQNISITINEYFQL